MSTQSLSAVDHGGNPERQKIQTTRYLVEQRLSPNMPPGIHRDSPADLLEAVKAFGKARDLYGAADIAAYEAEGHLAAAADKESGELRVAILADQPIDNLTDHTAAAERGLRQAATMLQVRAGEVRIALERLFSAFSEHAGTQATLYAEELPEAIERHRAATDELNAANNQLGKTVDLVAYWRTGAGGQVDRGELMHAKYAALGDYAVTSSFLSPEQRQYVINMRNRDANIERLAQRRHADNGFSE